MAAPDGLEPLFLFAFVAVVQVHLSAPGVWVPSRVNRLKREFSAPQVVSASAFGSSAAA
jgi:hypothetical protein